MAWVPTDTTIRASFAAPSIPYDGAGPWSPSLCASSVSPRIWQLSAILRGLFPAIKSIGTLNCRPNTNTRTGVQTMSLHGAGRALDAMIPNLETGAAIANWCVTNAALYGIQLVIFNGVVWQGSLPPRRRLSAYTGPNPHTDHVHVEVNTHVGYPGAPVLGLNTFPPGDGTAWVRSRFAMVVQVLMDRWIPLELAEAVAWAFLGQLTIEVGPFHAKHEWNFNVGNLVCRNTITALDAPGWHGACHVIPGSASDYAFRSYDTLRDGVTDYVNLHMGSQGPDGTWRGNYHDAFVYLLEHPDDPLGWYTRVLASHYSAPTATPALTAMYTSVLRDLAQRMKG